MSKDERYDRQLRLWGSAAQEKLERASVCIIGSGALASETLKNLVLPGIGRFVIVDNHTVTEADLGSSFFVLQEDLGRSRAEVLVGAMGALNELVRGEHISAELPSLLAEQETFLHRFSLVVSVQQSLSNTRLAAASCWEKGVPFLAIWTRGMFGGLRIAVQEHIVYDLRTENMHPDLRIANPFPALDTFARQFPGPVATVAAREAAGAAAHTASEADGGSEADYSAASIEHLPYATLLINCLREWREETGKAAPENRADQAELRKRMSAYTNTGQEENIEQATTKAHLMWAFEKIPAGAKRLFASEKINVTAHSRPFWLAMRAFYEFANEHGCLPHSGSIPDMACDTQLFLLLQQMYQVQAKADAADVLRRLDKVLDLLSLEGGTEARSEVRQLCRTLRDIRVIEYRSLADEEKGPFQSISEGQAVSPRVVDILLGARAIDLFEEQQESTEVEAALRRADSAQSKERTLVETLAERIAAQPGFPRHCQPDLKVLGSLLRAGSKELHVTCAVVGAVAAQESIKLLTGQNAPINNTFLWDGFEAVGTTLEM